MGVRPSTPSSSSERAPGSWVALTYATPASRSARAASDRSAVASVSDPIARVTAAGVRIVGTPASAAGSPASRLRTVKSAASARA